MLVMPARGLHPAGWLLPAHLRKAPTGHASGPPRPAVLSISLAVGPKAGKASASADGSNTGEAVEGP